MQRLITKMVNILVMIAIIVSLGGCVQKTEHEVETEKVNIKEEIQDEIITDKNNEVTNFQVVNEKDIVFLDDFVIPDYEIISTDKNSVITQTKGSFGGSNTNWYTIENNGIVYFYYQYLDNDLKPLSEPTYLNYAIVGEQYTLRCGIQVGMTEDEVYALLPDCVNCKPNTSEGVVANGVLSWNVSSFPEGWCEGYSDIVMANIEYSEDLPWYLGILLDKDGVVRAITTCYPTAG